MKQDEEEETDGAPIWLEDWLLDEADGKVPKAGTPEFYRLACRFIEATAVWAFSNGDNALLARAGFVEALEIVSDDVYAGSGGAHFPDFDKEAYAEILEEWREDVEFAKTAENRLADIWRTDPDLARALFWQTFDTDADGDTDAVDFRQCLLRRMRGGKLRALRKSATIRPELYNEITDGLIFADTAIDTANPEPARVFVDWLNTTFGNARENLAQWLAVANLPAYEGRLADLRKEIAANFGVFPAPFEVSPGRDDKPWIRYAGRELDMLLYIARAQRAEAKPAKRAKRNKRTLVTIEEAARILNVTRRTIQNWLTSANSPKVGYDEYFTRDLLKSPAAFRDWARRYLEEKKLEEKAKRARAEKAGKGRKRNGVVFNSDAVEMADRLKARLATSDDR